MMNKGKFTVSKLILFVNILVVITFILAYVMYNYLSDKRNEEDSIIAIEGIIENINNNLLSIQIDSISPKLQHEISKAVVLIDDSTQIFSLPLTTAPPGKPLPPKASSELTDASSINIGDKVIVFILSNNLTFDLKTSTLKTKANSIQLDK